MVLPHQQKNIYNWEGSDITVSVMLLPKNVADVCMIPWSKAKCYKQPLKKKETDLKKHIVRCDCDLVRVEQQPFSEQREQAVSQHDLWLCPEIHGIQNISTKPTLWSGHNCSPELLKNIFIVTEWSCIYFKSTWRSDSFWGKLT